MMGISYFHSTTLIIIMAASLCPLLLLFSLFFFPLLAANGNNLPQHSNDSTEVRMMAAPTNNPTSNKVVTHYLLVLQWPPSVCRYVKNTGKICNTPIPQDFKLHGLWPQGEEGSLVKCVPSKANEFNSGEVFKVKDLIKVWPTLFKREKFNPTLDTVDFWKYEWEEHGACSGLNPVDYFQKAVKLYDTLKLKLLLDNINVKPGRMYIIDVLIPKPKVTCGENTNRQFDIQELSINITAIADNFQPITIGIKVSNCPNLGYNAVGFP